jgi:hypothetical protein
MANPDLTLPGPTRLFPIWKSGGSARSIGHNQPPLEMSLLAEFEEAWPSKG